MCSHATQNTINKVFLYRILFLLKIFIISNFCNASPQLILFTDKSESTLGRPIRAELYGISLKTKISEIKLNGLNENFGVVTEYVINNTSDKRWPNQPIQILKLKLYPRTTGIIIIPGLSANKVQSQKKTIRIIKGKNESPQINFSTSEPYERQQFTVHITITSHDSNSRLSIKENSNISGFEITSLPFERIKGKNGIYLLKIGWALTVLKSGQFKFELPPIEHSISGVSRKKYYLPITSINIKPLPSYLPPTIPVGKVTIQSTLPPNGLLQPDSISYWDIKLSGKLNNTYRLPPILRQIKSNNHIKFLPINSKRSIKATIKGVTSIVNHSIPFKALENGFLRFPKIQLQYFDPESGKIKMDFYQANDVFVLSYFWRSLLAVFLTIFIIYIFYISYKKWMRYKFSRVKLKQAVKILQINNTITTVRESIGLLAEAENWPKNTTISQWAGYWESRYQVDINFERLISSLSSLFYSSEKDCNIKQISQQLIALINNRKKR